MGVTQAAGLSLKWFRDNLAEFYKEEAEKQGVDSYDLINQDVENVPIGSRRLLYLPYPASFRIIRIDSRFHFDYWQR